MNLDNAKTGGDLASRIDARNLKVAEINAAITNGWLVNNIRAVDPVSGNEMSLILETLDADTSKQALGFALQVYQSQLAALQAALAAL